MQSVSTIPCAIVAIRLQLAVAMAALLLCLPNSSVAQASLKERYAESVAVARAGALPSKVLLPVPAQDPHVRVVTWMATPAPLAVSTTATAPFGSAARDIWVSLESEIQPRCRKLASEANQNMALRIRQLLGLPDDFGAGPGGFQVIEIATTEPAHIFRPCLDRDPHRSACPSPIAPGPNALIDPDHEKWMRDNYAAVFVGKGFPWTRLGYTFDWGAKGDIYGVSEYVVPKSAPIRLREWVPLAKFCGAPSHGVH